MDYEFLREDILEIIKVFIILIIPVIVFRILAVVFKNKHNNYVRTVSGEEKEKAVIIQGKLKERNEWWDASLTLSKWLICIAVIIGFVSSFGIMFGEYKTSLGMLPIVNSDALYDFGMTGMLIPTIFISLYPIVLVCVYLNHKIKTNKLLDKDERKILNKSRRRSEILNIFTLLSLAFLLLTMFRLVARVVNHIIR